MNDNRIDWWGNFKEFLKKPTIKDPIRITGKRLSELAEKYNWKGTGAEDDPYIIDSIDESEEKIDIMSSFRFALFKNCIFQSINVWNCKNITFEHCGFNRLYMISCTQIQLIDSTILHLDISGSEKNYLKNCEIKKLSVSNIDYNTFEGCIMNSRNFKKLTKDPSSKLTSPKSLLATIILTFIFIPVITVFYILDNFLLCFISLISYLIAVALYIEFHERRIKDPKKYTNQIISN